MTETTTEEQVPTVLVLDGGFSSQLSCHVGNRMDGDPLWTVRFLQTHPEEVINTHLDFLRAGADAIMTNTYQAWVEGFVKHLCVTPEEAYSLFERAVQLAKTARDTYLKECTDKPNRIPLIVGSVGPYGAHLHDGSEYSGSYADTTSVQTMKDWHRPRITALIDAGVDLLALETIPCQKEADMLAEILKEFPTAKAWMTFSCKDDMSLVHGENFQITAKKCWEANPNQLVAVGVNCCSPSIVSNLLKGINEDRKVAPIPLVVYPNSGEKYNLETGWTDKDRCKAIDSFVQEWLDLGVRYIGGCCRTYAADITLIKTQVESWCDKKIFASHGSF